jgi:hypothetical protein
MLITFNRPSQRAHCSISIPNTRFRRRAQFMRMALGVGGSAAAALLRPRSLPAGVIAARSAACAANTP